MLLVKVGSPCAVDRTSYTYGRHANVSPLIVEYPALVKLLIDTKTDGGAPATPVTVESRMSFTPSKLIDE
jgi:hypothetical protein